MIIITRNEEEHGLGLYLGNFRSFHQSLLIYIYLFIFIIFVNNYLKKE